MSIAPGKVRYLLDRLEAAGKRSTPQRSAICAALVEHGGHPTASDVYERVVRDFPMVSQATVYNTISTLCELGLLSPLDLANHEHTHYDLELNPHINIVCLRCGNIVDLHTDIVEALLLQVSQRTGYTVDPHNGLIVYGICPKCRAENAQ